MRIAVIPARGGSKRIPCKNIRKFCGHPIIKYSIVAAQESGIFDKIIVSTDSDEIAKIAMKCGADVPFIRPKKLSGDYTTTAPVIAHAIQQMQKFGHIVEFACCIYATAPFVQAAHLRDGLIKLRRSGSNVVIPVTTFDFPIFRGIGISNSGKMQLLWPDLLSSWEMHETTRSNDLPEAYHDVGQFYWLRVSSFIDNPSLWGPETCPLVIPRKYVIDIDTPEDWEIAELRFKAMNPNLSR